MKKLLAFIFFIIIVTGSPLYAQLYVGTGTTFSIQAGGIVSVQGDVIGKSDITGAGKMILKGTANQSLNMNGFAISNLEMDNSTGAGLGGNSKVSASLLFTNGKIQAGNFDLTPSWYRYCKWYGHGKICRDKRYRKCYQGSERQPFRE